MSLLIVGWDKLASSAGPPSAAGIIWWAGAAKRRLSHPTSTSLPREDA